jgi:anti-sigma-K factor RskA
VPTIDTPHEIEDLLGAHALGALSEPEARMVEAHLRLCRACAARFAEYEQVAAGLLHLSPSADPPAGLRDAVLASLGKRGAAGERARPPERTGRRLRWAAGLAGAVLIALNMVQLYRGAKLEARLGSIIEQQQAGQTAQALRSYPSSRSVVVESGDVRGTFLFEADLPLAVLYIWGLPDPGPRHSYQAWLIAPDGERTSGGLLELPLGQEFASLVVDAPLPMREYVGFGVTLEPAGGSPLPTGPRILGADL